MEKFLLESNESLILRKIYNRMQDDESPEIYCARSLFSLTDKKMYMKKSVRNMIVSRIMCRALEQHKGQKCILFGAGTWGNAIKYYFPDINWFCYADNKKFGEVINGLKVISFDGLRQYKNEFVVVAVLFHYREVEQQLLEAGFDKNNILVLGRIAEENQYFDLSMLEHNEDEIFVDAGAFHGETTLCFSRWADKKYKHVYVFEPNESLYKICKRNLADLQNVTLVQKALWDKNTELHFVDAEEGSMCIEEDPQGTVSAIALDGILNNEKISFIKMDIEGAESKALQGAEQIIRKFKPKLAICVYHCRKDIWDIPALLLKYNPDYKFWLRTYSFTGNDTVLYAL